MLLLCFLHEFPLVFLFVTYSVWRVVTCVLRCLFPGEPSSHHAMFMVVVCYTWSPIYIESRDEFHMMQIDTYRCEIIMAMMTPMALPDRH
jgi:hypothetical protein